MRAAVLHEIDTPLQVVEATLDPPRSGDVSTPSQPAVFATRASMSWTALSPGSRFRQSLATKDQVWSGASDPG